MPEQRMSLEDAGRLLGGLHPNTIRARAAKGKLRYEKDNSGKWYVFIDPEKAVANHTRRRKLELPKNELEAPLKPPIEVTIQILNEELKASRVERDELKIKLNEYADETARLTKNFQEEKDRLVKIIEETTGSLKLLTEQSAKPVEKYSRSLFSRLFRREQSNIAT